MLERHQNIFDNVVKNTRVNYLLFHLSKNQYNVWRNLVSYQFVRLNMTKKEVRLNETEYFFHTVRVLLQLGLGKF